MSDLLGHMSELTHELCILDSYLHVIINKINKQLLLDNIEYFIIVKGAPHHLNIFYNVNQKLMFDIGL